MNDNEFDVIHNDDENENYFCVDSQARSDISNFDYKINCVVILPFSGTTTIDNITYNIFSFYLIPTVNYLQGRFSTAYDGACIRCLFDTYAPTMDTSLPFVIQALDQQTPPQPKYYHVYTDFNRQQKMQGLYKRGSVIDFVFDKTNQCFYLVGSAGEMNVQPDWNQTNTSADDYIKNKPSIPAAQVNSDWNASSGVAEILNKPSLANVATSGEADDVSYDNTTSGISATDVQDAIDEIVTDLSDKMDTVNPEGTGSFSMNRASGSTVGTNSTTLGNNCQAVSANSIATGNASYSGAPESHAEGLATYTFGNHSHSEGRNSEAHGDGSHAEGYGSKAMSNYQRVAGKFNVEDNQGVYAEIIGNGTDDNNRSDARELDWNGNEYIAGDLTINKGTASEMIVGQVLAGKQDALTAGSNVQISGNTISATDTKPTNHTNVGTGTESVANNTWTDIWTISNLPAGEYIVQIAVAWQSSSSANSDNGTGYRQIELRDTDTAAGSAGWINTCDVQATSGIRTCQQMTCPIRPTSATTYKLSVRHNAGTTIYAIPRIRYVKIG